MFILCAIGCGGTHVSPCFFIPLHSVKGGRSRRGSFLQLSPTQNFVLRGARYRGIVDVTKFDDKISVIM